MGYFVQSQWTCTPHFIKHNFNPLENRILPFCHPKATYTFCRQRSAVFPKVWSTEHLHQNNLDSVLNIEAAGSHSKPIELTISWVWDLRIWTSTDVSRWFLAQLKFENSSGVLKTQIYQFMEISINFLFVLLYYYYCGLRERK